MAELKFQENFEQWETWEKVDFTPDGEFEDFVYFKIGDAKKQIKVKMHKREFEMFVDKMLNKSTNKPLNNEQRNRKRDTKQAV